ncbi:MAG TPA: hypothetical protein VFM18_18390 [Methanosarcina sp.]|nr:hypothetical protein [Methanosarcina sp.]
MGHPLAPDLTKLSMEELNQKYGELMKRLTAAYRMGQTDAVYQLQMLLEDYRNEIAERNRKLIEDMEKNSKNFKGIIDIE